MYLHDRVRCSLLLFILSLLLPGWVQADLLASILPGKRTVQTGATATAFATIVNTGTSVATGCSIQPATAVNATFLYQTTNPATNALSGAPNTPVNIAPGSFQTFLFAFTPNSAFPQTTVDLVFDCSNTPPAPAGAVNRFSLGASASPVPDIIALAATAQNDGIVHLPTTDQDTGVFSVASINVGAPGMIDVSGGTGTATLPVDISVCETNPLTAACTNPAVPSANALRQFNTNDTATYSIFVNPGDTIALDPGNNRVFANFQGVGNSAQGVTSVATEGGKAATQGGGGTVVSTGSFGSLSLSGADTGVIGSRYTPEVAAASVSGAGTSAVVWDGVDDRLLSVGLDGVNAVIISFNLIPTADISQVYSYSVICLLSPADCGGIAVDLAGKTMTFTNVALPVTQGTFQTNPAKGPVVLNGTLSWN